MILAAFPADLASRLLLVIEGLRHAVGAYPYKGPAAFDLVVRVRAELRRRFERFERALARFQAGEPPRPGRVAAAPKPDGVAPARARSHDAAPARDRSRGTPRLPRRKAWLVVMMPYVVALYGYRLRLYVDDPAVAAFLRACPEARRILRPIWWMVSSDPLPEPLREPADGEAGVAAPGVATPGVATPGVATDVRAPGASAGVVALVASVAALALTHELAPAPAPCGVPVAYHLWEPQAPARSPEETAEEPPDPPPRSLGA